MDPIRFAPLVSQRFAADVAKRRDLLAGLAFVEGAASWGTAELLRWFEVELAARQVMQVPVMVREAGAVVSLASYARSQVLCDLLESARSRVVRLVSGMLAQPVVDAFLSAAIFSGRVQRRSEGGQSLWRAAPRGGEALSDIVLSLFVTDILSHRDFYDQNLAVCVTCGRISFESSRSGRTGCYEHILASHVGEGTRRTDPPPPDGTHSDEAVAAIREAWTLELFSTLRERSAWARLGSVDVAPPNGVDTVGGFADRQVIDVPFGRAVADTLREWRRTQGARLVDRALVYANNALLLRAPPPKRLEPLDGPWPFVLDKSSPAVVLGTIADCARVSRATLEAGRPPLAIAAADVRPGLAVVLSGRAVACWIVADVMITPGPGSVTVTTLVEVRSRGVNLLKRIDVAQ